MPRVIFEIRNAKDSEETPEAAAQLIASITNFLKASFLDRLRSSQPTLTLELVSLNQRVFFIITAPAAYQPLIQSQIAAQYPTAIITETEDYLPDWAQYGHKVAGQLKLSGPNYLPLKTYLKFTDIDPLASVLGVLGKTPPHTAAIVQFVLTAAKKNWTVPGTSLITRGVSSDPEVFKAHPQKELITEKVSAKGYATGIRLLTIGPNPAQAQQLMGQLSSAFNAYSLGDGNSLIYSPASNTDSMTTAMIARSAHFIPHKQILNLTEIASLFHFPGLKLTGIRNLAWGKTIKGEAPDNLPTAEGLTPDQAKEITFFAKTEFKNKMTEFGIKLSDRRRHFYVLGKSGTGKSTLLGNMAINDMQTGKGFAIIDPHGDLIEETLLNYIPNNRIKDVVYLDPSNLSYPFHLNPLEVHKEEHKDLAVSNIMSIFTKIWANVWSARMEHILRNALATLVEVQGTTMLDIPTILTDTKFQKSVLERIDPVTHRVIHDFWNSEFNQYNDRFKNEAIAPILNKVGQFISSPTIRQILREPKSTINVEEMMNSGKIVLINLSQGRIGEENAALLGAMFITQFQLAAMNRVHILQDERKDFFLYVDEFQNFATSSFVKILAEARKYRLGLVLANQYIAQIDEEVQKAIFGNIGTIATFVMGADDANHMMQEFGNLYTQEDLVNLGKWQIIVKISIDDRISNPFPAYTIPPPEGITSNREEVIRTSQELYTRARVFDAPQPDSYPDTAAPPPGIPAPATESGFERTPPPQAPEVGETYLGKVTNVKDYGVFVEILPDQQGLVHVSNLSKDYVKDPKEQFKKGDMVKVKLYEIDADGRLNLTMVMDEKPTQGNNDQSRSDEKHEELPLTPESIETVRKAGFEPTIVVALTYMEKVLLAFKHDSWQLPQTTIEPGTSLQDTLNLKLTKKLGIDLKTTPISKYLGDGRLNYNNPQKGGPQGKHYFGVSMELQDPTPPDQSDYDQLAWYAPEEARGLIESTNKGHKLDISLNFLSKLL